MLNDDELRKTLQTLYGGIDVIQLTNTRDNTSLCVLDVQYTDFGKWISVRKHDSNEPKFIIHAFNHSEIEKLFVALIVNIDPYTISDLSDIANNELNEREYNAIKDYVESYIFPNEV